MNFMPESAVEAPSLPEAEEFAVRIEQAFQQGDASTYQRLVCWQSMVDKAMFGMELDPTMREQLAQGFLSKAAGDNSLFHRLRDGWGTYKLLRVRTKNNTCSAIYRLINQQGLNYHEYSLEVVDGEITATDLYLHTVGEYWSETWRRAMMQICRMEVEFTPMVIYAMKLQEIVAKQVAQDHQTALKIYFSLPDEAREEKATLALAIPSARALGFEAMADLACDIKQFYPNDPCFDFFMLDYHIVASQHAEADACIDRIEQRVGGDKYLELYRSKNFADQRRLGDAYEAAKLAQCGAPEVAECHWQVFDLAVELEDYEGAAASLAVLTGTFAEQCEELNEHPAYVQFCQSPTGREWLARNGH